MLFKVVPGNMLWGDECPAKGYECSAYTHGFYNAVPSYKDLLVQYGMPHVNWDQSKPGAYVPGEGAALMTPHPLL